MKWKISMLATLGILFFISSCVPSIHPLYTMDKLVYMEDLLGEWSDADGDRSEWQGKQITTTNDNNQPETWFFEKGKDKTYYLIHQDEKGHAAAFEAHVLKLDKQLFLDFYPTNNLPNHLTKKHPLDYKSPLNEMLTNHLLSVHTFAKLNLTDERLQVEMFNPDFLETLLKENRIRIKHERQGDNFILTASSLELQKFVSKYANEKDAFLEATSLKRR